MALIIGAGVVDCRAEANLVADLGDSLPLSVEEFFIYHTPMAKLGEVAYFFNDDGVHGRELWRTDGTEAGTHILRDLCPGACGTVPLAEPHQIAALSDHVVFLADDGGHGVEIGVTDGTAAGTEMLADLRPGLFSSHPSTLVAAGARAYFSADDGVHGHQLWTTDGTKAGTKLVTSGPNGATAGIACGVDLDGVFLFAPGSATTPGLWRSDGTAAGTFRIAAIGTPQQNFTPWAPFVVVGDQLLFAGSPLDSFDLPTLWVSDGTSEGTHELAPIEDPYGFAVRDGIAYFDANDSGSFARRLWRSDATAGGTASVPLPEGLRSTYLVPRVVDAGGRLYFVGEDDDHGAEPWITDGESASRIADLFPGTDSSMGIDQQTFFGFQGPFFASAGETVVLFANDGAHGRELWTTDGTEGGTALLVDLNPGPPSTELDFRQPLFAPTSLAGQLLIRLRSADSRVLFSTDGTPAGSAPVSVLTVQQSAFTSFNDEASGFSNPPIASCFAPFGGGLFFSPVTREFGAEPWFSNGDFSGTELIADFQPGLFYSSPFGCASYGGRVLFNATFSTGDVHTSGIWSSRGSTGDQELVKEGASLGFEGAVVLDELVFFGAYDGLFASDGTAAGTVPIALSENLPISELAVAGDRLFVSTDQLLVSDGTPGSLESVLPPELGGPNGASLFTRFGDRVLFAGWTETGNEFWISDGTAPGTLDLTPAFGGTDQMFREDLRLGTFFSTSRFEVFGPFVLFAADDGTHGSELWRTDGTVAGTLLVSDLINGSYPSAPRELTRFGPYVYFVAESHGKGRELWRSDGTEAGTELVADLVKGAGSSLPENLHAAGSELYFSAWTPARGREAWRIRLDGSKNPQPVPLDEIAPGALSSSPQIFREIGGTVFTVANDNLSGFELWTIRESDIVFADGFEGTTTDLWAVQPPQ